MDYYTIIIILTTVAFFALAAVLLVPVWRFLNREEEKSRQWTESATGDTDGPPPEDGEQAQSR